MKNIRKFSIIALAALTIISCNKREIIPAPQKKVELKNHFIATINGTEIELTQNVNGFTGSSDARFIVSPDALDSAIYQSDFKSPTSLQSIKVLHGSVLFEASTNSRPSLAYFKSFYTLNNQPNFSNQGNNGIAFEYHDASGKAWKTKEANTQPFENAHYVYLEQTTDATGDYMKFKLNFTTVVYRDEFDPINNTTIEHALPISNGTYTGWYKR